MYNSGSRQVTNLGRRGNRGKVEAEAEEAAEVRPEREGKKAERNLARHLHRRQSEMSTC